jgi:uncharacterized protein (DUF488 family)
MRLFTIGYGGRDPADFLQLLQTHQVPLVVDVRLRPDRASMGAYTLARTPDKGIQALLARAGIAYCSLVELGNLFLGYPDYARPYQRLLDLAGDLLLERLLAQPEPVCLMCAEKDPAQCHRRLIALALRSRGHTVHDIV